MVYLRKMKLMKRAQPLAKPRRYLRLKHLLFAMFPRRKKHSPIPVLGVFFQEEIVKFLLLQMRVHHPRGVHREEDGAFALCWNTWKVIRSFHKNFLINFLYISYYCCFSLFNFIYSYFIYLL